MPTYSPSVAKQVRLTGSANVQATHSDGSTRVVDDHTYDCSAAKYFGPASISFEALRAGKLGGSERSEGDPCPADQSDSAGRTSRRLRRGVASTSNPVRRRKSTWTQKLTNYPVPESTCWLTASSHPAPEGFTYAHRPEARAASG
jgi:hypothetical protein